MRLLQVDLRLFDVCHRLLQLRRTQDERFLLGGEFFGVENALLHGFEFGLRGAALCLLLHKSNLALAQGDLRLHEFELVVVGRNASDDFALL